MSLDGALLANVLRRLGRMLLRLPRGAGAVLALAWIVVLYTLSEMDGPDVGDASDWHSFVHNLAHAPAFGLLAFWSLIALPRQVDAMGRHLWPELTRLRCLGVVAFVVLYGFADEFHQSLVPGRSPSLFDVLSDGVGACCVVWVAKGVGQGLGRGLGRRFVIGLAASAAAAGLSTLWAAAYQDGPWFGC